MAPKKKAAKAKAKADEKESAQSSKAVEKTSGEVEEKEQLAKQEGKDSEPMQADEKAQPQQVEAKVDANETKTEAKPAQEDPGAHEEAPDAEMKAESTADEGASKPAEEGDAPPDMRQRIRPEQLFLNMAEATPNVMPSSDGKLLMSLCDGGFQYLFAGVRASVGAKAGRYMFEVKIVEMLHPYEGSAHRQGKTPSPKQLVRLGFSLADNGPILDETASSFFFDSEGSFVHQKARRMVAEPFQRDQIIAVLLNMDTKSANANTVSLFRDGQRLCEPQPIPEGLIGKTLYASVTYKNVTFQVNWGPKPLKSLPFQCCMLQEAAVEDVDAASAVPPQNGKHDVIFPIGLPDQGIFDWLDQFLEEHPRHFEFSDRKILEWASTSGVSRQKGYQWRTSNDKPGMNFGIQALDDFGTQRVLLAVAPTLKRDVVCMELNANLQASERRKALKRFPCTDFRRIAVVAMGEPPEKYKAKVREALLAEKTAKAEREKKQKQEDAAWKAALDSRKRRYGEEEEEKGGTKEHAAEDEEGREQDQEKQDTVEAKEGAGESAEAEVEKPIELTEEEKGLWFRKQGVPDLTPAVLGKDFANYSVPNDDEGFDEVRFVWQQGSRCAEILKDWLLEHKRTQRIEDLEPSAWFKEKWMEWQRVLGEWKRKQTEAREAQRRKALSSRGGERGKERSEKRGDDARHESGDGEEAEKKDNEQEVKEGSKPMEIDEDELDVFAVEDILDLGNGKPLFMNFVYEDWALLSLRYELHLLVHAFRHDVDDPDRPGFHESHLAFYYNKYFGKAFNVKYFGVQEVEELCALVKDTAALDESTRFLKALLPEAEPLDRFLRFTEEHRRERQRCIDAGDETALLKFTRPAPPPPRQSQGGGGQQRSSGGDGYPRPSTGGHSRGPPPPTGRSGPQRGGYGSSSGARGGYGPPPSRGSHDAPVGASQKRPYTPPPPSPAYPPSKHQRSGYGSSHSRAPAPPPRSGHSSGGSYGGRSYR